MIMSDVLKKEADKRIVSHAKEFFEQNKTNLIKASKKGYKSVTFDLNEADDAHIIVSDKFLEALDELLGNCRVEITEKEFVNYLVNRKYTKKYLQISW